MATVEIQETQLVNEDGNGYGWEVVAVVKGGDRNDGIDALVEKYGDKTLYDHRGDVWNQFNWSVKVN